MDSRYNELGTDLVRFQGSANKPAAEAVDHIHLHGSLAEAAVRTLEGFPLYADRYGSADRDEELEDEATEIQ